MDLGIFVQDIGFKKKTQEFWSQELDWRILGSSFLGSRNTQNFFEKVNSGILLRKFA